MAPFGEVQEVTGVTLPLRLVLGLPMLTVTLPVVVQPPGAVTVTDQVPGPLIVMLEVVAPVLQRKSVNDVAFVTTTVPVCPGQRLAGAEISGFVELPEVTSTESVPVQPLSFVTVTE